MDALKLLTHDHQSVERLFRAYERTGKGASKRRVRLATRSCERFRLTLRSKSNFSIPRPENFRRSLDSRVLEALEEHHLVKGTLAELEKMSPRDERFDAKIAVLRENVRHHVEEEEGALFPRLRRLMDGAELGVLGEAMDEARKTAPTHPHPLAPDSSPGNVVAGALATILDSGQELVRGTARSATRVVTALKFAPSSR